MSRRAVLKALCASNGACEAFSMRAGAATIPFRTFSSTMQRNAHIAHFTPSSSRELDELLSTIREKIILPSYLRVEQRKMLYAARHAKKLESDPIVIEIDGEVFRFRYQNPLTDIPSTKKSVLSAIEQFAAAEDFANLRPLLEGIYNTRRKLPQGFYSKIIRTVCERGYTHEIIESVRTVKRTGLKLDSSEKINELMHWCQMKAIDSEWDEAETQKALRWTEMILELVDEEAHQPSRPKNEELPEGTLPFSRDPQVLLAPLHLAAAMVSKHEAGEEMKEKTTKYAKDIIALWPEQKNLREVYPPSAFEDYDNMGYLLPPSKFVALASPLLHGLRLASEIVDSELSAALRVRADNLDKEIEAAREQIGDGRGEAVYGRLFASQ